MTDENRVAAIYGSTRRRPATPISAKAGFEPMDAALAGEDVRVLQKTLRDTLEHFIAATATAFETAAKPGGKLHQVVVDLVRAQASSGGPANRKTIDTRTVCELWQSPADDFFRFSDPQLLQWEQFLRVTQCPLEQAGRALLRRWSRAAIPAGSKHRAQIMRWLQLEIVDRLGERGFSLRAMLTRAAHQPVRAYLADVSPTGGIE